MRLHSNCGCNYTELHVLCLSVSTSLWSCWHLRNCNQLIIDLISHNGKKFWSEWNDCHGLLLLLSRQEAMLKKNLFLLNLGSFYTDLLNELQCSSSLDSSSQKCKIHMQLFVLILLLVTHWLTKDEVTRLLPLSHKTHSCGRTSLAITQPIKRAEDYYLLMMIGYSPQRYVPQLVTTFWPSTRHAFCCTAASSQSVVKFS